MSVIDYDTYLTLVVEVNRLRDQLHLFSTEEISEAALDDLKHKITVFEEENPDKISSNSPNYHVSGGVASGFEKYTHQRRMLSLNDIFDFNELEDWEVRWGNYLSKNSETQDSNDLFGDGVEGGSGQQSKNTRYICEPKIDGLAISLHYENGELIAAATRGDGWVGELVTQNVKQIKNVPKTIQDKRKIEVRGEIFLTKEDFLKLNQDILEGKKVGKMGKSGEEGKFANPRNIASGTIRQLDSRIVGERNLSFIAYGVYIED